MKENGFLISIEDIIHGALIVKNTLVPLFLQRIGWKYRLELAKKAILSKGNNEVGT